MDFVDEIFLVLKVEFFFFLVGNSDGDEKGVEFSSWGFFVVVMD